MYSNDDDGEYDFEDKYSDDSQTTSHRLQNYNILSEGDILQLQEEDITRISTVLSISRISASILLHHYNWNVSNVHDAWFADKENVRKTVGLLEKLVVQSSSAKELTCGICFENYPPVIMQAASCGHPFCSSCWKSYISTSINDGTGCLMLRCPDTSCSAAVDQDMINILVSDEDKGEEYMDILLDLGMIRIHYRLKHLLTCMLNKETLN